MTVTFEVCKIPWRKFKKGFLPQPCSSFFLLFHPAIWRALYILLPLYYFAVSTHIWARSKNFTFKRPGLPQPLAPLDVSWNRNKIIAYNCLPLRISDLPTALHHNAMCAPRKEMPILSVWWGRYETLSHPNTVHCIQWGCWFKYQVTTKVESPGFLRRHTDLVRFLKFIKQTSNHAGDFVKIVWPSLKTWTGTEERIVIEQSKKSI